MGTLHTHAASLPNQVRYGIAMKKTDSIFTGDETRILSININIGVERSLATCARTRGLVPFLKGDVSQV